MNNITFEISFEIICIDPLDRLVYGLTAEQLIAQLPQYAELFGKAVTQPCIVINGKRFMLSETNMCHLEHITEMENNIVAEKRRYRNSDCPLTKKYASDWIEVYNNIRELCWEYILKDKVI